MFALTVCTHLLRKVLLRSKKTRKEVGWIISNIAAGTPAQVAALCNPIHEDGPDTFDVLVEEVRNGTQHQVRKECAWVFANAVYLKYICVNRE